MRHAGRQADLMAVSDWELWAAANHILRQFGDRANDHVAERVTTLDQAGDRAGVEAWISIAERMDQLRDDRGVRH
jgi:hypothetical protein